MLPNVHVPGRDDSHHVVVRRWNDARYLVCSRDAAGRPQRAVLCDASGLGEAVGCLVDGRELGPRFVSTAVPRPGAI